MMKPMLDYVKLILQKVSFDKTLFEKELRKAIARLMPVEVEDLRHWCYAKFSEMHYMVLDRCFTTYTT
ncbi:hypothetical protein SAMN05421823_108114 [Catalinimonas alkaloidigena]|uniref:Uncharacterized protein n=1 Tax=Catalinimonas alkaloidigena TaxID=1075417 RepID=A0A1G9MX18_9BACT|nr:hypothetical protein SAMN05421823_108114 [Catalinimonas alkaloidigena]